MSNTYAKLAVYAKLLLIAQKNLLFVGAPGTGKTRLARLIAKSCTKDFSEPIIVVGRDGLSYDRLVAYYSSEDGTITLRFGELSQAILSSWVRIGLGLGPRYLLIDELNRCNADVLLGEVFTALDIEHRMKIPVIRGHTYSYAKKLANEGRYKELGLDIPEELEILKRVFTEIEKRRSETRSEVDGIPMPYAFRILATMNVYDRAQLYRIGYALQRRFAYLYIPTPFEDVAPRLAFEKIEKLSIDGKVFTRVYKELSNVSSTIVSTATKEMSADLTSTSLLENDYPTAPIPTPTREEITEIAKNALETFDPVSKLVAYVYSVALEKLRVELGISTLVDVVKLFIATFLASPTSEPLLKAEEVADLVLSALVLPQLSVAIPRVRSELLIAGAPEESATYRTLISIENKVNEVLGEDTLSMKVLNSFEIPRM